ncbi:10804_t:CDS:2 [Diversispora eburnea]|uniref:10804_t:CDS:1 n=1 Tax=Diversispora eburnea TaxID=1213867 RepID=A0A9N9FWM8_9GLOM|nr:10804_t:CDS:2 [Diversispora eburnea]
MSTFYNQLSENFGSLLETEINHDVIIQVGKFPNQKQFKVHSLILRFTEIELWNKLIEWGKAHIQDVTEGGEDIMNWSKEDFNNLEEILHDLIPLIRFFQIFSDDFYKFVYPYKRILPKVLRKDLVAYYITSYYTPESVVLPARKTKSDDINSTTSNDTKITETQNYETSSITSIIQDSIYSSNSPDLKIHSDSSTYSEDSSILSEEAKTLIENWINESEKASWIPNYLYIGKTTIQKWRWNLLYRASWNGYSPVKFHQECDNKGSCVIAVKIKNEPNKVIGGYNPVGWYKLKHGCIKYSPTKSSFIYHLDEMDLNNNSILCRVKQNKHQTAICQTNSFGPTFGYFDHNEFFVSKIIKSHCHTGITYQSGVDIGSFEVEDYEVFQLVKE